METTITIETTSEEMLTIKELAARIGFNYYTVVSWPKTRGMPVRRTPPRGRMSVEWHEFLNWWSSLRNDH